MQALDDVSLEVQAGERLALVGENGAGKSSLMNVLSGLYRPDAGEVRVDDVPLRPADPREAFARGVRMVHQHYLLVPTLTVAENLVLGREPTRAGFLDLERAAADVTSGADRLGFAIDPHARVGELSVAAQQKVEILKALRPGARALILDEPTAVLTPREAEELFHVTRQLSSEGLAVVFIGHKLKEVLAVATRIAVMRGGRKVAEVVREDASAERIAAWMVGDRASQEQAGPSLRAVPASAPLPAEVQRQRAAQEQAAPPSPRAAPASAPLPAEMQRHRAAQEQTAPPSPRAAPASDALHAEMQRHRSAQEQAGPSPRVVPASAPLPAEMLRHRSAQEQAAPPSPRAVPASDALHAEGLVAFGAAGRPALRGLDLRLAAGELLGIAGVDGNGQRELAEILTGLRPRQEGTLRLAGLAVPASASPAWFRAHGVGHVPEDRLRRGLIAGMTVEENLALGRQGVAPFAKGQWIDRPGRTARARALIQSLDVRPPDPTARAGTLSGGNQQKVVVARELDAQPRLLVVVQPTRGLDLGAVARVQAHLLAARAAGCAVLLISLDLDELLALSDRLCVLREGRIVLELERGEFDERKIGEAMTGAEGALAHA